MEDKVIIKKDEKQVTLDNMIDVSEKIVLGHPIGSEEIERKMAKVQTAEAVKATALTPEAAAKTPGYLPQMVEELSQHIPQETIDHLKEAMKEEAYQANKGSSIRKLRHLADSVKKVTAAPAAAPVAPEFVIESVRASEELNLPLHSVEQIPFQTVWHGNQCDFLVDWKQHPTAVLTMEIKENPAGEIKLEPFSGDSYRFTYVCDESDKFPFNVTITATEHDQSVSQTFEITPMQKLPPEQIVFGLDKAVEPGPVDFSKPEVIDQPVTHTFAPGRNYVFNYKKPTAQSPLVLRKVSIIGQHVVFDKSNDEFGIYGTYHGNQSVELLEIFAEEVEICSPLHLPQTNVIINARKLNFKGKDARITTTPISITTNPPAAQIKSYNDKGEITAKVDAGAGQDGLPAGNLTLNIEEFHSDPVVTRFDVTGGAGQNGGNGVDGVAGKNVDAGGHSLNASNGIHRTTYTAPAGWQWVYAEWVEGITGIYVSGKGVKAWPTSGTNALPSGKPGEGGQGGSIISSVDEAKYAVYPGGKSGQVAQRPRWGHYRGGHAGYPTKAKWIRVRDYTFFAVTVQEMGSSESHGGKDAQVVNPKNTHGAAGSCTSTPRSYHWLHPLLVSKLLNHAKDDYLGNRLDLAQPRLTDLVKRIEALKQSEVWSRLTDTDRAEMAQMADEMLIMLHRLDNNLDYFGHPAGWAPLLSFEVNERMFDTEIDRAAELLYYAYFLKKKIATASLQMENTQMVRSRMQKDIEDAIDSYNTVQETIASLRLKAENLLARTVELQHKLEAEENELRNEALDNLKGLFALKGAILGARLGLKIGGMIISMLPVGQPATGMVGSGLTLISNIDPEKPWDTIIGGADITTKFLNAKYEEHAGNLSKAMNADKLKAADKDGKLSAKKDFYDKARNSADALTSGLNDMQEFTAQFKMPEEEINAELEKLKSQSETFKGLVQEMKDLIAEKKDFADELTETIQELMSLYNFINYSMLAIDAMNADMAKVRAGVDKRVAGYLDDMERRCYDRLLEYHYYLAKAYEYRLLRPYSKPLDFKQLLKRLEAVVEADVWKEPSPDIFKSTYKVLYKERLAEIANEIFKNYNEQPREKSSTLEYKLSADELKRLNQGQTIQVNFTSGLPNEENLRMVDVGVLMTDIAEKKGAIKTSPVSGTYDRNEHLDLIFEHPGVSLLISDGTIYKFQHKLPNAQNPFIWDARYFPNSDHIQHSAPAEADQSLLKSLLTGNALSDMMLYSRPSACTDLELTRDGNKKHGKNIKIDELTLVLTYDYVRSANDQLEKEALVTVIEDVDNGNAVVYEASFRPYFIINKADKNGRQDARGHHLRIYDRSWNDKVKISVQPRYSAYVFNKWTDVMGNVLANTSDHSIVVDLKESEVICAQFVAMEKEQTPLAQQVNAIPLAAQFNQKLLLMQKRSAPIKP